MSCIFLADFTPYYSYIINMASGLLVVVVNPKPEGWLHLAVVFSGTRLQVYYDGEEVGVEGSSPFSSAMPSGSSHVVLGRPYYSLDSLYSSVEVDELTLWNN